VPNGTGKLVSVSMAAAALGVSRYAIRRWILSGELQSVRIGERHWIPLDVLEAFTAAPGTTDDPPESPDTGTD